MRRPERVAEVLKEEISEIVGYELTDPRLENITVTEVELTENLRDAKVFVLIDGEEKEIGEALKALRNAAPYVRRQVALNLDLRHAPALHFIRDTVEEKAQRIDLIISELAQKGEFSETKDVEEA